MFLQQHTISPYLFAVSNALALTVGNRIFTATQVEGITHYTLQAKSCANWGVAPLESPICAAI